MRRSRTALLATALLAVGASTPALAGPPAQSVHYDGVATITENNTLLHHDGTSDYGNTFVQDYAPEEGVEDLFGMYVSQRHIFSITFDDNRRYDCGGVSHVFFEGVDWWEATAAVGDTALGSVGIWCDQGDNTAYAVRYPDYPRSPSTEERDPDDCVVATRLDDTAEGGRQYRFATPAATGTSEPEPGPLDGILPPGSSTQEEADACEAEVFHVTEVNSSQRTETPQWKGAAAFEVTVTLQPAKKRGR